MKPYTKKVLVWEAQSIIYGHNYLSSFSRAIFASSVSWMISCPATTVLLLDVVPLSHIQQSKDQEQNRPHRALKWRTVILLSMVTWGHSRDLTAGCESVERWIITMQHYRVHRVSLLKFKQQLLHGLNRVVTTQIDHYFLYLETDGKHRLIRSECLTLIFVSGAEKCITISTKGPQRKTFWCSVDTTTQKKNHDRENKTVWDSKTFCVSLHKAEAWCHCWLHTD